MATIPAFGSTSLATSSPSTYPYLFNDFMLRRGGLLSVINTTTSSPPGSPAIGDSYLILSGSPTGAWSGKSNNVAIWFGNAWNFIAPYYGMTVMDQARAAFVLRHTADIWFYPEFLFDAGTKGTGTFNLSSAFGMSKFAFSASGVNVTITPPSPIVSGHTYVLYGSNDNASSCTLTFGAASWYGGNSSYSIAASTYFALTYTGEASGARSVILSLVTGASNI